MPPNIGVQPLAQIRAFHQNHAPVARSADQVISPALEIEVVQFETQLQEVLPADDCRKSIGRLFVMTRRPLLSVDQGDSK
jgi:hypothetical protein